MAVDIDAEAIWCQRHKDALGLDPKRSFQLACQRLFDFAVRHPVIMIECGYMPGQSQADPDKLTDVLAAHSPLCCFIDGKDLDRVYREAYFGKFERAQREMIMRERTRYGSVN